MTSVFLWLLLLGGLSGAEFLGDTVDRDSLNEISGQVVDRAGGTRTSAAQIDPEGLSQQACQPDIHAVLRDMTALMTEQRVELRHTQLDLRHTQLELKAVTERLRDSENLFKGIIDYIVCVKQMTFN